MSPAPAGEGGQTTPYALLCGIDEAGLGPILGPLSIGYSVFRVPNPRSNLWSLLARVVGDKPSAPRRIVVADSKKVFTRNARGRKRLEMTALSFLALLSPEGKPPTDPLELFGAFEGDVRARARIPWYRHLPQLPAELAPETLELEAALLARELAKRGCALLDAGVRVITAAELNSSFAQTHNKAKTLWAKLLGVLMRLWDNHGLEGPHVTVDMLGGQLYYGSALARSFQMASVRMLRERGRLSVYELRARDGSERRMRVTFRAKGEESSFAVALASCLAKYARETVMGAFNAYFSGLQPELRPTAGYRGDGQRWLTEARAALDSAGLENGVLVRER